MVTIWKLDPPKKRAVRTAHTVCIESLLGPKALRMGLRCECLKCQFMRLTAEPDFKIRQAHDTED